MNAVSIAESLRVAARQLARHSESPRLDAELLLGKVLGLSRSGLIAHDREPLAPAAVSRYADFIAQRIGGVPVAYLTGSREFWSLAIHVTPAELVPRPETETLVERALELMAQDEECSVLDLGTGSGAIALALASERPRGQITGVDFSSDALAVAAQNSNRLKLPVRWRHSRWFDALAGERFHLVVSNPPYVAAGDPALAALAAEPAMALRAGDDGLEAFTAIIAEAAHYLHPKGWLVLEHGANQAQEVAHLLERHGFDSIHTYTDFSCKPRVTLGTLHTQH